MNAVLLICALLVFAALVARLVGLTSIAQTRAVVVVVFLRGVTGLASIARSRRCPNCGRGLKADELHCPQCDFDLRAVEAD